MTQGADLPAKIGYVLVAIWLAFLAGHVALEVVAARRSKGREERTALRAFIARMTWRLVATALWALVVFRWQEDWPMVLATPFGAVARWIGLAAAFGGICLQSWARRVLGKHFSALLTTQRDHRLVREGPYRWMRHPIYTGFILMFFGLALALNSWMFFWLMAAPQTALFVVQILYEEPLLIARLGNEYRVYQQEVPALIPRLGRRKK
ncbi:MAG: methyltransferase family protein [bacterium]